MPEACGYLILKLAGKLYNKPPDLLAVDERQRVATVAARQREIERRILTTAEAGGVVLAAAAVDRSLDEIRGRYADEREFRSDLARNGLDEAELRDAIGRDLKVEAVLEGIANTAAPVGDTEVEIFYLMHKDRFQRPETRTLRHILITINDAIAGSERAAAQARIEAVRERLAKSPGRFAEEAARHSECPTAMSGGLLGQVRRGQLFGEIEPAAFALRVGEISAVVESPLGFHVLRCDSIEAGGLQPLESVSMRVRQHLEGARRRQVQKAWIAGLFQ